MAANGNRRIAQDRPGSTRTLDPGVDRVQAEKLQPEPNLTGSSVRMADIVNAEEELVLEMFAKLKDKRDGELRISTRRNPRTGIVEIIYAGAHEKGDLSKVRRLYEQAGRGTVTF